MAKFDLTGIFKDVSDLNTGREQIVYLPLDKLHPAEENFYSLDGIEDLADNIALIGLQQPLRVRPDEGDGFTIISGHRRCAALLMIRDGGSDQFADGVPCIVELSEGVSSAMQELRLIFANSATRVMTPADLSKQAERVTELLYQLHEEGVEFEGRMRDHVAKACQVSAAKIGRLHAIRNNLTPELLEYFDGGKLNESVAYRLSQESPESQHTLQKEMGAGLLQVTLADLEAVIDREKRASEIQNEGTEKETSKKPETPVSNMIAESIVFFKAMTEPDFFRYIAGRISAGGDRGSGIYDLKVRLGLSHAGGSIKSGYYDCDPKGLTFNCDDADRPISRTWTEVYDLIAARAIQLINFAGAPKSVWRRAGIPSDGLYVCRFKLFSEEDQLGIFRRSDGVWLVGPTGTAQISSSCRILAYYKLPEE